MINYRPIGNLFILSQNITLLTVLRTSFKGGYLDFSHLTELKNFCITEIYMKKQYKSSIINNHKTVKKDFLMVFP